MVSGFPGAEISVDSLRCKVPDAAVPRDGGIASCHSLVPPRGTLPESDGIAACRSSLVV